MAIKLIANYSKRLGLPGYSSHQFEVSIETEIGNTSELPFETERLYSSLQSAVDAQIRQVGFIPDASYGSRGVSGATLPAHAPGSTASCAAIFESPDILSRRTGMELFGKAEAGYSIAGT